MTYGTYALLLFTIFSLTRRFSVISIVLDFLAVIHMPIRFYSEQTLPAVTCLRSTYNHIIRTDSVTTTLGTQLNAGITEHVYHFLVFHRLVKETVTV